MKLEPQTLTGCFVVLILKFSLFSSVFARGVAQDQAQVQGCENEVLIRCTSPMVKSQAEISPWAKKEVLDRLCPDLEQSMYCVEEYTKRCMTEDRQNYFNQLYRGTAGVIRDLCQEGPYQEEYMQHSPCVKQVQKEYDTCAAAYEHKLKDLNQKVSVNDSNVRSEAAVQEICCSYQDYVRCYTKSVLAKCGPVTAEFIKGYMNKMAATLMVHCVKYLADSERCLPYLESSAATPGVEALTVMLVLALLQLIRT